MEKGVGDRVEFDDCLQKGKGRLSFEGYEVRFGPTEYEEPPGCSAADLFPRSDKLKVVTHCRSVFVIFFYYLFSRFSQGRV